MLMITLYAEQKKRHRLCPFYVTVEIPYSTVHVPQEVFAWSGATLSLRPLRASP